jgi:hypothetical protein
MSSLNYSENYNSSANLYVVEKHRCVQKVTQRRVVEQNDDTKSVAVEKAAPEKIIDFFYLENYVQGSP